MEDRIRALEERMNAVETWMENTDGYLERLYETVDLLAGRMRQDLDSVKNDQYDEVDRLRWEIDSVRSEVENIRYASRGW